MLRSAASKVMWVGRATTFCVGLAVVLAVAFGVGTTALAAVPGDPFKLGRVNAVDRITSLVGANPRAMLKVDNNGGGPALALESEAGKAPLAVNAGAGKAANLDADKLDGLDASAFLPADGKAAAASHADTAGNADKLDGLDSDQFLRGPVDVPPWARTVSDSSRHKKISAYCPPEHMAISGEARVMATRVPDTEGTPGTGSEVPVGITVVGSTGSSFWRAEAQEMAPFEGDWYLLVEPLCVPVEPEGYDDAGQ